MSRIHQEQLPNGLWLLAEPIAGAQSLAMSMLLPAGVAAEPVEQQGVGALLAEMICRGAGDLDARAHCDALDRLGVHRATSVQTHHLSLSATMIGTKLRDALPLLMDMVRRPRLPETALAPSRDLALQSLDSLDDEPQQRVMLDLRRRHFPEPFGRSPLGQRQALEAMTVDHVRAFAGAALTPQGSILGFAGRFDWPALRDQVLELLGDWTGQTSEPIEAAPAAGGYEHRPAQTAQVHIALAYEALPEPHVDSLLQRAAATVLSGGMSGRLFTEVREKRGLCYAVMASYAANRDRGAMTAYAGTTPPRAQETLDVMIAELKRLSDGVNESEFQRAIIGMKSRLVMQGESTGARASAIVSDQYTLGRPRTLDELAHRVDAISLDKLNRFVRAHPPGEMTVVTVGPASLQLSH